MNSFRAAEKRYKRYHDGRIDGDLSNVKQYKGMEGWHRIEGKDVYIHPGFLTLDEQVELVCNALLRYCGGSYNNLYK